MTWCDHMIHIYISILLCERGPFWDKTEDSVFKEVCSLNSIFLVFSKHFPVKLLILFLVVTT